MSAGLSSAGTVVLKRLAVFTVAFGFVAALVDSEAQVPQPSLWTVKPVLRIDAQRERLLPLGGTIAVARSGIIALSQRQGMHFLIFDSLGHRLGSAGRAGEGPGEFGSPGLTYGWIGDSLWVAEVYGRRASLFATDGHFIRVLNVPAVVGQVMSARGESLFYGNPFVQAIFPSNAGSMVLAITSPRGSGVRCPCMLAVTADEKKHKLVMEAPSDPQGIISVPGGGTKVPFFWSGFFDASPDGRFVSAVHATSSDVNLGRFRVTLVRSSGDTAFTRAYNAPRVGIPASEIDRALADRRLTNPTAPIGEMRRRIPQIYQPFENILMGRDSTVWVRLRSTGTERPWLVLDKTGNPIGRINMASNVTLVEAERRKIWAVEEDVDGLQSLVVLTVVSGR